ncbi:uncharacterized protein ACOB6Z_016095 [Ctenodactylus gundi]
MVAVNESLPEGFLLLGFADRPWLELPLFIVLLLTYPTAMMGNVAIIVVSRVDPRLHSPMYFFLTNLSFLDMCYTTSIVPQMLLNLGSSKKTISYMGCVVQLYLFSSMGATECLLLAIMSFDRYVAICRPLHYTLVMSQRVCISLVAIVWLGGITYAVSEATVTLQLPLCGINKLDHLLCEIPVLIKTACGEKEANELALSVVCIFIIAVPLCLILASYVSIGRAILRIKSSEGRKKAFGTCSSHLIVVFLFYGPAISMYLQPPSSTSRDQPKFMALFYGVVTPTLNPFIYTLRNKDVKGALGRLGRSLFNSKDQDECQGEEEQHQGSHEELHLIGMNVHTGQFDHGRNFTDEVVNPTVPTARQLKGDGALNQCVAHPTQPRHSCKRLAKPWVHECAIMERPANSSIAVKCHDCQENTFSGSQSQRHIELNGTAHRSDGLGWTVEVPQQLGNNTGREAKINQGEIVTARITNVGGLTIPSCKVYEGDSQKKSRVAAFRLTPGPREQNRGHSCSHQVFDTDAKNINLVPSSERTLLRTLLSLFQVMGINCSLWQDNSLSVKRFAFAAFSETPEQCFLLFALVLLMFLASLTGNALIALAIRTNPTLHTPMYFFLANLSLLEIGYTSSVVPQMLQNLLPEGRWISREGCATQMFFFTFFAISECCLLAAMAFDRYMAICSPLHYATRMNRAVCTQLAIFSWGVGCTVGLGQTNYIFSLNFCGPCEIDHLFCDLPPILALACGDTSHNEVAVFVVAILCISSPFLLIITSYGWILATVLAMPSPEGRHKALSTCSSHLLVVTLFYGSGSVTYLRPKASHSPGVDKLLALFYTVVTSMLNPIIYSLRNKEVKAALQKTLSKRKTLTQG